ncbi:MAG: branched-chain amino acid transaminase [Dehalococcoidales bacterium]|nr:branched-chain amino acid transaminase [Dehalococcoidales bacterium]
MPSYAFLKKQYLPLADANLNIMTNFMHYGTGVFEGIRGNWNKDHKQIYLFRLKEHYERLFRGCQVLNITLPYTVDDLCKITIDLVNKSGFTEDIYVRPLAYKSSEALGVRLHNLESDFLAFVFPWGPYLDTDRARCVVASWRFPTEVPRQKLTGLYITNALAKSEAVSAGFDEAIMLNAAGYVTEGSGENLFIIREGKIFTPLTTDGALTGITRDTVMKLAKNELGLETIERHVERIELYAADEIFMTGTAAHLTPISEIDRRKINGGEIGPITHKLQKLYADVIQNKNLKYSSWCTPVYKK